MTFETWFRAQFKPPKSLTLDQRAQLRQLVVEGQAAAERLRADDEVSALHRGALAAWCATDEYKQGVKP